MSLRNRWNLSLSKTLPRTYLPASVLCVALPLSTVTLVSSEARAQAKPQLSESQRSKAGEHYQKAKRLYDLAKYKEAVDEYQAAYLISADPALLFNIAQSYRLADQPIEAVRFYRNYLRNAPDAPNRADVEKRIADLEKQMADRERAKNEPAPPPVVTPAPAPVAPPPVVAPAPAPVAPPVAPAPPPPPVPAAPPPEPRSIALPVTLLAVGGVALAGGVVAGLMAKGKASKLEEAAKNRLQFDPKLESDGKLFNTVFIVAGSIGVVCAGVGAVLLATGSGGQEKRAANGSSSSVALFPILGPGLQGAGARMTF